MIENIPKLKIDEEFRFLIPPLPDEEYSQLEQNIMRDGCTDPIKVWAGHDIILDGHNRYEICTKEEIEYKVYFIELETREDAINWIIDNQLGRRNLTESQRSYLRGKRYNNEKKTHGGQIRGSSDQSDHSIKTAEKIAAESNVGSATIRRDAKYAAAVDSLKKEVGQDFGKKLISEEIKLPKSDVIKLAEKPIDEKKALVSEIQKGTKSLSQAEMVLQTGNESQKEIFIKATAEIEFAGWSWNPKKLDAPKNTPAPKDGSEVKQRLVYLSEDIFGENFDEDETEEIVQVMRESPQWIFMVHTENLEKLEDIDWPTNVWIGCKVDSDDSAQDALDVFKKIDNAIKFMIIDIRLNSNFEGVLSKLDWVIICDSSNFSIWDRTVSILFDAALEIDLCTYLMPNLTVRPREYPMIKKQLTQSGTQEVAAQESSKGST
jgi:hypothetical protein